MKKKNRNQIVFPRHMFWNHFYRPIVGLLAKLKHYKRVNFLKMKKGESYIVLANHQSSLDGILIPYSFQRHLYGLTTDSFFSKGWVAKMFVHQLGLIAKRKGAVDIKANMDMIRCVKEGGSLLIFPEGNRGYAEFQFSMTEGFAKFVRFFKKPIVLFNFHGGSGVDPRFAKSRRKGPYYGEIKRILQPEEIESWSDEKLYQVIKDTLRVYDSESGALYKSDERAEYLERMFFVCPKCGKVETLYSEGNYIHCKECGLKVEYTEDLHLKSDDPDFKFSRLVDWYNYQIRWVKNFEVNDEVIFKSGEAKLFVSHPGKKRKLIAEGPVELTAKTLKFAEKTIDISEISIASPINGNNFNFSTATEDYYVKGDDRFNPLKYIFMFNKLDIKMRNSKADIYYNLEERN